MNAALQVICRISILAPVWFCASQVIGVTLYSPVEVPKTNETDVLGVPSDIFEIGRASCRERVLNLV